MFYLADVALILLVAVALIGAGWAIADEQRSLLENTALGVCAWVGGLALLIALTGHFVSINLAPWFFFLPPVVALGMRIKSVLHNAQAALRGLKQLLPLDRLVLLYLVFVCALTLFLTLAPPHANDYDSLVYHLAAPQRYLLDGRITELPYDHHTYFPFAMEMFFAIGLKLSGPVLAKLFHWLMLPFCLLTIIAIGQRHASLRGGLLAAALFASIPIVLVEATTAYIDLGLTLFVLAAFLCFINWLQTRQGYWLLWSGAMCGFSCNMKYFGALFFGWLLLWAIGDMAKRKEVQLKPLLGFCALTAVLGGFYYIRNWFWVGNPVYPFAYEIFGGKGWTLEMAQAYARDQEAFGFGKGPLDWLLLPFRASWSPLNFLFNTGQGIAIFPRPYWPFLDLPIENSAMTGRFETAGHVLQTIVGPALLAFTVPTIFLKNKPLAVRFLLWSFLFFWLFWAVSSQQLRYLIPTLALLGVASGWGMTRMQERGMLLRWTVGVALVSWLLFVPRLTLWRLGDVVPVALGQADPQEYVGRMFGGYNAMEWASKNTDENALFAIFGEPRNYYLKRRYFWGDDAHNNLLDFSKMQSGRQFIQELKNQKATHVLWNTRAAQNGGFGGPPPQIEEAIAQGLLSEIYESRGYRVLRIN
jgi:hypothetical protein